MNETETVAQSVRRLGHGALADQLKLLLGGASAATLEESGAETEEDPVAALINEAATRLGMIDMVQSMGGGMNQVYSDDAIAQMTDEELAALLDGQSTSALMDVGEGQAPLDLSTHGDSCLERRLAKEAARRLRASAAVQHGEAFMREFVKTQTARIGPFRPV